MPLKLSGRCAHVDVERNAKVSWYPDGRHRLIVASRPIFREDGWESPDYRPKEKRPQKKDNEVRKDSVRRAMQTVYDIARLNRFTHFITWTLDRRHIDRYNSTEVSKRLKKYLQNMVQRYGLKYLIIPETHKDGAIHMHGLISGNLKFFPAYSEKTGQALYTKGGQRICNMPQWTLGHSTAIELDQNTAAISRYITKYITKDAKKIFGNFYYAGGGIDRKPPTTLYDVNYHDVNAAEYVNHGTAYKYLELGDERKIELADIMERLGMV